MGVTCRVTYCVPSIDYVRTTYLNLKEIKFLRSVTHTYPSPKVPTLRLFRPLSPSLLGRVVPEEHKDLTLEIPPPVAPRYRSPSVSQGNTRALFSVRSYVFSSKEGEGLSP